MKILDRYLWGVVVGGTLLVWFSLTGLDLFFAFLNALEDIDPNASETLQAATYLLYTSPRRLYDFFPTSTLIGSILGLGALAANSEFIAMRAAGVSIVQITGTILKLGLLMALMIFSVGEWLAPMTEQKAQEVRLQNTYGTTSMTEGLGFWAKEEQRFIHVGEVYPGKRLTNVEVYEISEERYALKASLYAEEAIYTDGGWQLKNTYHNAFSDNGIVPESHATERVDKLIPPELLDVIVIEPKQMSAQTLYQYIQHRKSNGLDATRYELAFWTRFTTPLSTLVMLLLAMPFVFGSQRSTGAGQRLFIGILLGVLFFLTNRIMNHMGLIFGYPPIVSAFTPLLLFLGGSLIALYRVR